MKKKNIFAIVLAMALVAVVSVGATIAYLTATTKEVKNTFKFADGMEVKLTEPTPSVPPQVTTSPNPDGGHDYTNILPGQELGKNPIVHTTTPVDAYLFVKVSGANALLKPKEINKIWTPVDASAIDSYGNGVYYMAVTGEAGEQGPFSVFEKVVVDNVKIENGLGANGKEVTLDDIIIQVYEVQQQGFKTVADAAKECKWKTVGTGTGTGTGSGTTDPAVDPANPAPEVPAA